jgi:hypothetical protein
MRLLAVLFLLRLQQPVPADSLRSRLFIQGELTWYGVDSSRDLSNRLVRIAAIHTLGFGGTRLPVEWVWVEPSRGHRNWARLDSTVSELKQAGLTAYGVITYSPSWAVPPALAHNARFSAHRPVVEGSSAKGDTLFAAFAAEAARRYRGFVDRWEVWNEQNHPAFWIDLVNGTNKGPDAADYARLFAITRDSILAANPQATVAVGGLTSLNGLRTVLRDPLDSGRSFDPLPPEEFVRGLVAARLSFSTIGLHPYSMVPPGRPAFGRGVIFPDLVVDSVLAALGALGLTQVHVWVTEWGVHAPFAHSQSELDEWYRDALRALLCRKAIEFVTVHTLMDVNSLDHFGLLRRDGTETANGLAFRRALTAWNGCGAHQ